MTGRPPGLAPLQARLLGTVEYADGLRAQEVVAEAVREGRVPDQLLLLAHPPVVTLGRRGERSSLNVSEQALAALGIELFHVDRGGDITYHDPGQLVGYPIWRLAGLPSVGATDGPHRGSAARALVWTVEELLIRTLGRLGLRASRREGLTGVWLPGGKVAAVGLRIDRGVTRHGFALDLATPAGAWNVIVPCGLSQERVVSVSTALGRAVPREELLPLLLSEARELLGRPVDEVTPKRESVQVVVFRRRPTLEVLILRRVAQRGGFWQPVTGMLEPGEAPLAAAVRELHEETGLQPDELRSLGYTHSFLIERGIRPGAPDTPTFLWEHSFAAEVPESATERPDPREHDAARWVAPAEAVELFRWPGNRRAVQLLLDAPETRTGRRWA